MRTHSFVSSYISKGSHAPLYLSTPSRLHSSLKQCILLLGRCFLLLLLTHRVRLSLLLVVLVRMPFSELHDCAHTFALLCLYEDSHTAPYSSVSSFTHSLCCFPLLFCCCFLPRLLSCYATCACFLCLSFLRLFSFRSVFFLCSCCVCSI